MHTDETLTVMERATAELGRLLRQFRDQTCSKFATTELPREAQARQRRAQATGDAPNTSATRTASSSSRKKRTLNLFTPKFHALGDYVPSIRLFGTTDSYSTQLVWQ